MKGTGVALAIYEIPDLETNEIFNVTIIQFDDEQAIVVENKKTGKGFGIKYGSMEDLWELVADFTIRNRDKFGGGKIDNGKEE